MSTLEAHGERVYCCWRGGVFRLSPLALSNKGVAVPGEFHAICPDCSHEWDALTWFEQISDGWSSTPAEFFFCQDCYTHLSVGTNFDRLSWKRWLAGHQSMIDASKIVAHAVAIIDDICSQTTGYPLVLDSAWPRLSCPSCERPLLEGSIDECSIRCPRCHERNARSQGVHSIVSVLREMHD
jgi:hypothetical protein